MPDTCVSRYNAETKINNTIPAFMEPPLNTPSIQL